MRTMHKSEDNAAIGLHIVPQYTYHADAQIVGTAEALLALRDAISYAIEHGETEMETFASDGEGYALTVRKLDAAAFRQATPYYEYMSKAIPDTLCDLISDYDMARTDGANDVDRLHRWQKLVSGIRAYAKSK